MNCNNVHPGLKCSIYNNCLKLKYINASKVQNYSMIVYSKKNTYYTENWNCMHSQEWFTFSNKHFCQIETLPVVQSEVDRLITPHVNQKQRQCHVVWLLHGLMQCRCVKIYVLVSWQIKPRISLCFEKRRILRFRNYTCTLRGEFNKHLTFNHPQTAQRGEIQHAFSF